MKRLLSLILALSLVISLVPAVFAEEGGEATQQNAGITITYDVTKNFGSWGSQTPLFSSFTYEANNGLWEYYGNAKNLPSADKSTTMNWVGTAGMQMNGGWWAIKIIVPKSGVYTPKVNYRAYREASMMELYLVSKNGPLTEADMNENNLFGKVSCHNAELSAVTTQEPAVLDPRYIEAGEYYFVYKVGEKLGFGTGWIFFGNFTLDGNGTETVAANVLAEKEIEIPNSLKRTIHPIVYDNTGAVVEENCSFESSDTSVATVDDSGVVTAVSEGEAIITTSVANSTGYVAKCETKVTVVEGAVIKYDLIRHYSKDLGWYNTTAGSLNEITEELTDGFYSYAGGNDWTGGDEVKYYENLQLMKTGTHVAFKINVPVAGTYHLAMDVISRAGIGRCNVDMQVYISSTGKSTSESDYVGSYRLYDIGTNGQVLNGIDIAEYTFEEAGDYYITYRIGTHPDAVWGPYSNVGTFYLVGGTKSALMNGKITSSVSSINVDEGETAEVVATGYLSSTTEAATFTYSSSNTAVATVDEES
ncbi:MAG: hypothetical protein IJP38_06450, partial [Oscillospiraceae bacterium]|nr:hypothetical protein [Oscillospiraceae bacterium]